jgi:hypothetical protein
VVFVCGSSARFSIAARVRPSWAFIAGVRARTGAPATSASFRVGSAELSDWIPGRRRAERTAKLSRNGRCAASASVPSSRVGGPLEIVALRASGSAARAPKVSAMLPNSAACSSATGATIAAVRPSAGKKSSSCVSSSIRTSATGLRFLNSGLRFWIVSLSEAPRAAKALP